MIAIPETKLESVADNSPWSIFEISIGCASRRSIVTMTHRRYRAP